MNIYIQLTSNQNADLNDKADVCQSYYQQSEFFVNTHFGEVEEIMGTHRVIQPLWRIICSVPIKNLRNMQPLTQHFFFCGFILIKERSVGRFEQRMFTMALLIRMKHWKQCDK